MLGLAATVEEFAAVARVAASRLEAEGIAALVSVQFYARPDPIEVGAVLTSSDGARMMEHVATVTWCIMPRGDRPGEAGGPS